MVALRDGRLCAHESRNRRGCHDRNEYVRAPVYVAGYTEICASAARCTESPQTHRVAHGKVSSESAERQRKQREKQRGFENGDAADTRREEGGPQWVQEYGSRTRAHAREQESAGRGALERERKRGGRRKRGKEREDESRRRSFLCLIARRAPTAIHAGQPRGMVLGERDKKKGRERARWEEGGRQPRVARTDMRMYTCACVPV